MALTQLVEQAREGDEDAFAALARATADRCFAIAYRILRDVGRAEDAVQVALVTAWRELPRLREPERFEAWLHRLLVHACYAEARRGRKHGSNVRLLDIQAVPPAGRDAVVTVHDRDQLERGFRRLPPDQRAVLVLHHYLDLTMTEVADRLGIPVGTAKSRLHYATTALRAALEADARSADPARERTA
jgi:RNA polymerase sigma-70 factor (ECF subfamily)